MANASKSDILRIQNILETQRQENRADHNDLFALHRQTQQNGTSVKERLAKVEASHGFLKKFFGTIIGVVAGCIGGVVLWIVKRGQ